MAVDDAEIQLPPVGACLFDGGQRQRVCQDEGWNALVAADLALTDQILMQLA
ncbi:hypothetical protein SDC9_148968 [bioreactor metagenome]|uniref:Uncharacterized protein n=1 Tax=bioreactor metagenome TaxID=1076179 RepID=A0A645EJY6_9ZZZZ